MTPQQFVGLGVRIFAIWLAITGSSYLVAVPFMLKNSGLSYESAYNNFIAAAYIISAIFLWFFPMTVSQKLIPHTKYDNNISVSALELARVGCCLLGLWFFSHGLFDLVWFLFRADLISSSAPALSVFTGLEKADIAVAVFKILFSVLLIVKSITFARFALSSKNAE
jgi:uncharacterized membrane protein